MPQARLDRWLGLVLLLFALGWSWIVVETIPTSPETGVTGPRVFPLMLGMLLGAFGLFTLASGIINSGRTEVRQDKVAGVSRREAWVVATTFAVFVGYGFLLDTIGFLLATPIAVVVAMRVVLGLRDWIKILLMAAGLTAASYAIFAILMGANLPRGSWIQLV